ncbi:MAG: shikimate dehydrogenase [Actinomycetota bacterium]|nr:shikimate dehydrogenase [Actinomycetota bacterium]
MRLGVLGWPVAHSRSPAMQNAALRARGLSHWHYGLLPVAPELLVETVAALPRSGFRGANVTIPHKQTALALAEHATARARGIGAANTLTFEADGVHADNTDAPALVAALPFPLAGRSALVLGAGGSARAAVWALLDAGAGPVRVWNRTPARARELCAAIGGEPVPGAEPADVLVHCTSTGLDGSVQTFKQLPLAAEELGRYDCVVDFVYSERETELISAARSAAIPFVDGLDLLVGQGALSFERFTGQTAPVEVMRGAVRWP